MNILVLGGTRFFGIPMVKKLIEDKHDITIVTRGNTGNIFGDKVTYIQLDRTKPDQVKQKLSDKEYDVIIDKIAYCSNDVKNVLDYVSCKRYIMMSTCSVYYEEHENLKEEDFDPINTSLEWLDRLEDYPRVKRSAECAVAQVYNKQPYTFVRYPIVLGKNDYTKRLWFYVDHIVNEKPFNISCENKAMSFISEDAAGEFIAHLVNRPVDGPVNGAFDGMISTKEIIQYIEEKSGKKAILANDAEDAPFNGLSDNWTFNTEKAKATGFEFGQTKAFVKELIDYYMSL